MTDPVLVEFPVCLPEVLEDFERDSDLSPAAGTDRRDATIHGRQPAPPFGAWGDRDLLTPSIGEPRAGHDTRGSAEKEKVGTGIHVPWFDRETRPAAKLLSVPELVKVAVARAHVDAALPYGRRRFQRAAAGHLELPDHRRLDGGVAHVIGVQGTVRIADDEGEVLDQLAIQLRLTPAGEPTKSAEDDEGGGVALTEPIELKEEIDPLADLYRN